MDLVAGAAAESALRELLALRVREPAHLGFYRVNRGQADAELNHTKTDENRYRLRIAGDSPAHASKFLVLASAFNRQRDEAKQTGVEGINLRGELWMTAIHWETAQRVSVRTS